jgi:Ca2+-binding RTX toxin-like protein
MAKLVAFYGLDMTEGYGLGYEGGTLSNDGLSFSVNLALGDTAEVAMVTGTGMFYDLLTFAVTGGTASLLEFKRFDGISYIPTPHNLFTDHYTFSELRPGADSAMAIFDHLHDSDQQGLQAYVLSGADTLTGSLDNDTLMAYAGKDKLYGKAGNDKLHGMTGDDTLDGGAGNDVLTGGGGADTFYFLAGAARADRVLDFSHLQHDRIALASSYFAVGSSLDSAEFKSAADISPLGGAANANAKILYDSDSGRLYYDADGSGSASKPLLMAVLGETKHPVLGLTDFIVT